MGFLTHRLFILKERPMKKDILTHVRDDETLFIELDYPKDQDPFKKAPQPAKFLDINKMVSEINSGANEGQLSMVTGKTVGTWKATLKGPDAKAHKLIKPAEDPNA